MATIYDRDGVVFLNGEEFSLKIDGGRKIYIKTKEDSQYSWIGHYCPDHYTLDMKKNYLSNLYQMILAKKKQEHEQNI